MADSILVPSSGLAIVTGRIKGSSVNEPNFLQWGEGSTPPVAGNTALETPRNEARVTGTSSQQTQSVTNDCYQVVGTITCASTAAVITEVALLDSAGTGTPASGGNLFVRGTFSPINLNIGDSVQFTVKTVFSAS